MSRFQAPDHAEWADSIGAYLLEALPESEREGFERHLAACGACREDVEGLRVATDTLPASVAQLVPPPALKARIMAVVEAEAELLEAASGPRADLPEARPARRERRRFGLPALRPAFALACAMALLVLGGLGGALLAGGDGEGSQRARTVVASVDRGEATGRLVVAEGGSRLELRDLAEPPRGRVYQVWTLREGGAPVPSTALFVPRADGSASVAVPGSLEGVDQVLVSDEPVGGSPAPTSAPFLSAEPGSA